MMERRGLVHFVGGVDGRGCRGADGWLLYFIFDDLSVSSGRPPGRNSTPAFQKAATPATHVLLPTAKADQEVAK